MKALLRYPSFYLAIPMLASCLLTLLCYRLPDHYLPGLYLLTTTSVLALLADAILRIRLPAAGALAARDFTGTREGAVAVALGAVIILFCLIDITLFPIPLIVDPSAYATLEPGRTHVRHISYLCWILPPVALLCLRNPYWRGLFIAVAFIFPILVIDRNRLFATLFSLLVVMILRRKPAAQLPWTAILIMTVIVATTFSLLGVLRSGALDFVTLPFSDFYREAPLGYKWLFLYMTAGIYNFCAILANGYHNAEFLLNQLIPMRGSVATLGTSIPLESRTINIGTEYFPFLMALGWPGVVLAIIALYGMLLGSAVLLQWRLSPFTLLVFLRLSYVAVMAPFAPQAFTWSSFAFIGLCGLCIGFASILPTHDVMRRPRQLLRENR